MALSSAAKSTAAELESQRGGLLQELRKAQDALKSVVYSHCDRGEREAGAKLRVEFEILNMTRQSIESDLIAKYRFRLESAGRSQQLSRALEESGRTQLESSRLAESLKSREEELAAARKQLTTLIA